MHVKVSLHIYQFINPSITTNAPPCLRPAQKGAMEAAIQTLVKVFLKSSKGKETLGKKEFQGLVSNQLSNILLVRKSLRKNLSEISLALCNQPLAQKQTHQF